VSVVYADIRILHDRSLSRHWRRSRGSLDPAYRRGSAGMIGRSALCRFAKGRDFAAQECSCFCQNQGFGSIRWYSAIFVALNTISSAWLRIQDVSRLGSLIVHRRRSASELKNFRRFREQGPGLRRRAVGARGAGAIAGLPVAHQHVLSAATSVATKGVVT